MTTVWLQFAIFPFVLFFLGAALVTGLPLAVELSQRHEHRRRSAPGRREAVGTGASFIAS